MREVERIARLLEQTFEGQAYYGPSVRQTLEGISVETAVHRPNGGAHSVWELVSHLTAELLHACALLEGNAVPWVEGKTTWPDLAASLASAWDEAVKDLRDANRALVRAIEQLDDTMLDQQLIQVRRTYYVMLHGVIQHNAYHAGQISMLKRQLSK